MPKRTDALDAANVQGITRAVEGLGGTVNATIVPEVDQRAYPPAPPAPPAIIPTIIVFRTRRVSRVPSARLNCQGQRFVQLDAELVCGHCGYALEVC